MTLFRNSLIVSLFFSFFICSHTAGKEIQVVTSEFAPFNYTEEGIPKGFCTEIVQAVLRETGTQAEIRIYPWSRAYQTALKQENTLIYTIARIPDREALFHWIGVIVSGKTYLFSLKDRGIEIDSLDQAGAYTIGAVRNGIRSKHLISKGIVELDLVKDTQTNAVKLINNRIDLWVEDELSAVYTLKKMGHDPDKILKRTFELDLKLDGYMAFSINTAPQTVETFRKALKQLIENGTYEKIKSNYL